MNKKIVKIILIISGVLLLLGLGIYGYKYIKNKNSHKNTNENENQLKEVSNLTTAFSNLSAGSYNLTGYYNGPINVTSTLGIKCTTTVDSDCRRYNYYGTIYVNDSVKLKSSWIFQTRETFSSSPDSLYSYGYYLERYSYQSNLLINMTNNFISCYGNIVSRYPSTKIFNANTGDLIFEVPTNGNEKINLGSYPVGGYNKWSNNIMLYTFSSNGILYYAKSNYNLTGGNNVEIHYVQFKSDNTYTDGIYGYTNATITTNS